MFGYVKAYNPELRVREAEYYRAVYCGLCREMRKRLGVSSALALSYDMAFLALCRMSVTGERPKIRKHRCIKLKKRPMTEDCEAVAYAAGISALLTSRKLRDDISDEAGMRRLRARIIMPFAKHHLYRASVDDGIVGAVDDALRHLDDVERSGDASVSDCAAVFGDALSAIFSYGLEGDAARIMAEIGRCVGRFVYIIDEVDDMDDDERSGRRNRIRDQYPGPWTKSTADAVSCALCLELERAIHAADLLGDGNETAASIVKNVLSLGMKNEAMRAASSKIGTRHAHEKRKGS